MNDTEKSKLPDVWTSGHPGVTTSPNQSSVGAAHRVIMGQTGAADYGASVPLDDSHHCYSDSLVRTEASFRAAGALGPFNEQVTESTPSLTNALPGFTGLLGVRRVTDATSELSRPAMKVEFVDGVVVTVARDEISRNHFCVWLPKQSNSVSHVMPKLTADQVMTQLEKFAAAAARTN